MKVELTMDDLIGIRVALRDQVDAFSFTPEEKEKFGEVIDFEQEYLEWKALYDKICRLMEVSK